MPQLPAIKRRAERALLVRLKPIGVPSKGLRVIAAVAGFSARAPKSGKGDGPFTRPLNPAEDK